MQFSLFEFPWNLFNWTFLKLLVALVLMHSDLRPRRKGPKNSFAKWALAVVMFYIFTGIPNCVWVFLLSTSKKSKVIPVTGCGGLYGCETSRLPHFLNSRHTDGVEVVSLTHRPVFTTRKIPGTHFCYRLSRSHGHSAAGRIRSFEKIQWPHRESNPRPSGL
jgi:hypothetical protein